MFHKTILAGVTAAAVGFAGLAATPAQADSDTAKIITGLAALAIIGAGIAHANDDRRRYGVSRYHYDHSYHPYRGYEYHRYDQRYYRPRAYSDHRYDR